MTRIYLSGGPIVPMPRKRAKPPAREPGHYETIYKDTGCHLHPSCLNCPRPRCIYDTVPDDAEDPLRWTTQQEIARRLAAGEPTVHIAAQVGVSTRTVDRRKAALKK